MIPRTVAVLVDYLGNVHRDLRNPSVRLLHEANFAAVQADDGTFTVWKDREAAHASGLSSEAIEARVRHFVGWAQLRDMMPRAKAV